MLSSIDPRGQRFAAAVTTFVLAIVLVTGSGWLLAVQGAVFAAGAFAGPARSPYGLFYARVVRPRLGPPRELEDAVPPRFAQAVGLAFAVVGVIGFASGLTALAYVAAGAALAAAFLNAAFGFCLGCEIYLAYRRLFPSQPNPTEVAP
ncbi:DUF4395 domain-containing protein [Jiangella asiatica]|uniref:DUF4395 domain-containing protein n=1 Tax=Jiangella asiatica TaxID=2530372 RepID=A0A4R5CM77_9ACTN|nr:DUF4395 domain-containing protein [Jiangella asiatica]TDE01449.1 DUF4395 domain-containing protein [Jiangella asiatica]